MREMVQIQVGHHGNQIGYKFWEFIGSEHNIDINGIPLPNDDPFDSKVRQERANIYYNETKAGVYIPRTVLVDLDPKFLIAGPLSNLIPKCNIIYGYGGCNNNWAKGHYTDGAEMIDTILEGIRREVECCDALQGFQIPHSLGGGTGAGLGTLIISKLREEYPDRSIISFSVTPYSNAGDSVVAPYNAILALHQLMENTDQTLLIDNEALLKHSYGLEKGNFNNMNSLVASMMSGLTSCFRFSSPLNLNLQKIGVKMIPFPRLHFFISAVAPNAYESKVSHKQTSVADLTQQMFVPNYSLTSCDPCKGKHLATTTLYQGLISIKEIEDQLRIIQPTVKFARGCSENITTALCSIPQKDQAISSTYVINSTAIKCSILRLCEDFKKLYESSAFLHSYIGEGMDNMEFLEALSNCEDLVTEYKQYERYL
ncbi:Tubulin beta Nda3 [Oopsacas minuta]|uniref:Tubulin beta chain n=1 Tax=Oopsacas minuta TaxID=111878 RepID=A0AAV7K0C5_9METZ|nr:Tubulin beta Nda3 [Oopsacas minuta]